MTTTYDLRLSGDDLYQILFVLKNDTFYGIII